MKVNNTLLRYSRQLHIYLSVVLLVLLVFFSITGITLNHPNWVNKVQVTEHTSILPAFLAANKTPTEISQPNNSREITSRVNTSQVNIVQAIEKHLAINLQHASIENEDEQWFIDLQIPGESYQLTFDSTTAQLITEHTYYGLIAKLNDLHKGRHAHTLWKNIIDISGVLVVLFSLTGLLLLLPNKKKLAPTVWFGIVSSVVLVVSAMH